MPLRRRRRTPEPPALPVITAAEVNELRAAGRLAHVELYPLPDLRAAGASGLIDTAPAPPPATMEGAWAAASAPGTRAGQPQPQPQPEQDATSIGASPVAFRLDDGRVIEVVGNGMLGRAPRAEEGELAITIDDPGKSLSRTHLRFERDRAGRVFVSDAGSANGTELLTASGERVECDPQRRQRVTAGDVLLLGEFSVHVVPVR